MIELLKNNEFDAVFAIMQDSFPDDEYRPYNEQKALLELKEYKIYIHRSSNTKKVDAFITLYEFDGLTFIEHFAVSAVCRHSGIGSEMLKDIFSHYSGNICLEVELPEGDNSKRRIAFYERNGFVLNGYRYVQPPISKGKKPVPLLIMTAKKEITHSEFEIIRKTLYKKVYRISE